MAGPISPTEIIMCTWYTCAYFSCTFYFPHMLLKILSEVGTVQTVLDSGDIRVKYPNNRVWTMNSDTVVKVSGHCLLGKFQISVMICFTFVQVEHFKTGDVVRILDDIAKVHTLQENHGGWVDDMALVGDNNTLLSLFLLALSTTVSGTSWSSCHGLPHWRCPSACQWSVMDI